MGSSKLKNVELSTSITTLNNNAFSNTKEELYQEERLLKTLSTHRQYGVKQLTEQVIESVRDAKDIGIDIKCTAGGVRCFSIHLII